MSRGWRIAVLTFLGIGFLLLAYRLRGIVLPLLGALLLAYILHPALEALERRGVSRSISIAGLYVLFLGLLAAGVLWGLPRAAAQARRFLSETFTGEEARIRKAILWGGTRIQDWLGPEQWEAIQANLRRRLEGIEGDTVRAAGRLAGAVGRFMTSGVRAFVTVLSLLVLVPVYLFFFLKNLKPWEARLRDLIPAARRDRWLFILGRIHRVSASFFRGQLAISLLEGALLFAGLGLMGVKFAFLFGLLYAFLSLLPFIGVVTTFAAVELFILADAGGITATNLWVAGLFAGLQILESFLLQPWILGRETGLHPVAIIVSLLAGGELFGIFGMLIAVPLAATIKILLEELVLPLLRDPEEGPPTRPAAAAG